jgi:drug/metabolite transporter (DMT)-like permease
MASHDNARGIAMMLAAIGLLSCMDAGLKELSTHYPAMQVTALRSLASWPFVALWVPWKIGVRSLLRVRWPLHVLRGTLFVVTLTSFVFGIRQLPLTTAYTLFFIAPLVITILSAVVLRERVDAYRWGVIAVGFVGVLVALRPTGEGAFTLAGLAVLGAAVGYSLSAITARVLGRTDSSESMLFWTMTLMAPVAAALAAPQWVAIQSGHWLLIAGVGLVGAAGQYALTEAFARGESSVVAPFEYTALAWGVMFDLTIWHVLPDAMTWLGAAIIVAAGIYLMRREHAGRASRAASLAAEVQP